MRRGGEAPDMTAATPELLCHPAEHGGGGREKEGEEGEKANELHLPLFSCNFKILPFFLLFQI